MRTSTQLSEQWINVLCHILYAGYGQTEANAGVTVDIDGKGKYIISQAQVILLY